MDVIVIYGLGKFELGIHATKKWRSFILLTYIQVTPIIEWFDIMHVSKSSVLARYNSRKGFSKKIIKRTYKQPCVKIYFFSIRFFLVQNQQLSSHCQILITILWLFDSPLFQNHSSPFLFHDQ